MTNLKDFPFMNECRTIPDFAEEALIWHAKITKELRGELAEMNKRKRRKSDFYFEIKLLKRVLGDTEKNIEGEG